MFEVVAREPEIIAELRRAQGRRLATFRDAADLTQAQLAVRVFVDRTTITHLEGGTGGKGSRELWTTLDTALDAVGCYFGAIQNWWRCGSGESFTVAPQCWLKRAPRLTSSVTARPTCGVSDPA
jgi:DNA-binding XRE family transcriptional regulator